MLKKVFVAALIVGVIALTASDAFAKKKAKKKKLFEPVATQVV